MGVSVKEQEYFSQHSVNEAAVHWLLRGGTKGYNSQYVSSERPSFEINLSVMQ